MAKLIKTGNGDAKAVPVTEFAVASIVLLLLEAFLLYYFFVGPRMAGAAAAGAELAERRIALADFYGNKIDKESLAEELNGLLLQIRSIEEKLPPTLHNEDISIMIGDISREHNISIESVSFAERQLIDLTEYVVMPAGSTESKAISNIYAALDANGNSGNGSNGISYSAYGFDADAYADGEALLMASALADPAETAGIDSRIETFMQAFADTYDFEDEPVALGAAKPPAQQKSPAQSLMLSVQNVQINFTSEFHTAESFIKAFEDGERKARVRNASLARVQEGVLKGVLNLEFVAFSATAEQGRPGLNDVSRQPGHAEKDSLFGKYNGFVEDNADPTILLLSEEDDVDPDFYIVLKSSASNETKVSYGVYPRVESELRSNVNSAVRAKLTISGDAEQFEYVYSLASYQKSEKRKLSASGGKLRLKVLSCQRIGDSDNVAVLLDVDNNTDLPFEIIVVNDDVLSPRLHMGLTKGNVTVVNK